MESSTTTATAGQAVEAIDGDRGLASYRGRPSRPGRGADARRQRLADLVRAADRVDALAGGLATLGVRRGDCVAIMLANRPEFHIVDLAAVTLGATPFSIYTTYPRSGDRVPDHRLAGAGWRSSSRRSSPVDARGPPEPAGPRARDRRRRRRPRGGARAGRRGGLRPGRSTPRRRPPRSSRGHGDADLHLGDDRAAQGRPAHPSRRHVSARGVARGHRAPARRAGHLVAAGGPHRRADGPPLHSGHLRRHRHLRPNPREVLSYLPQVRPNWFFAVPRIWEKLKAGLEAMQAAQPEEQRAPVQAGAGRRGRARAPAPARRAGPAGARGARSPRPTSRSFSKLRAMLGLDQAIAVNVGAAPTPVEVLEFFHALGIELAELWGMSETCGVGAVNRPGAVRIGTVGRRLAGRGAEARRRRRGAVPGRVHDVRLSQPAREDRRGDRRRRLAAHRRHRRRSTPTAI